MLTYWSWFFWCELVHGSLYDFMCALPDAEYSAMNRGFDLEEQRWL